MSIPVPRITGKKAIQTCVKTIASYATGCDVRAIRDRYKKLRIVVDSMPINILANLPSRRKLRIRRCVKAWSGDIGEPITLIMMDTKEKWTY